MKKESALISLDKNTLLMGWGNPVWQAQPNLKRPAFYFPDFFLKNPHPWLSFDHYATIPRTSFDREPVLDSFRQWTSDQDVLYASEFRALKKLIASQAVTKAIPYIYEESQGPLNEDEVRAAFQKLLQTEHSTHLYGFWVNSEGILGGTPERLFELTKEGLITEAVAGTASLEVPDDEFVKDAKLLLEHQIVVEGIVASLRGMGRITLGELEIYKLPHIKHLKRTLSLQKSRNISWDEILDALHPTPALGAFPKEAGKMWLANYPIERNRYGAPVGCIYQGKSICYVGIRNVQWDDDSSRIYAGGGVVESSTFQEEWKEIQWKLRAIKTSLALIT